jgi:hypothetical protein
MRRRDGNNSKLSAWPRGDVDGGRRGGKLGKQPIAGFSSVFPLNKRSEMCAHRLGVHVRESPKKPSHSELIQMTSISVRCLEGFSEDGRRAVPGGWRARTSSVRQDLSRRSPVLDAYPAIVGRDSNTTVSPWFNC